MTFLEVPHSVSAPHAWTYPTGYSYSLFQESFSSVLDGTSNTTIFSEHHRPDTAPERSTFWSNVPALHTITTSEHAGQMLAVTWERCRSTSGQSSEDNKTRYCSRATGSYHSNGVNACLGDGSVKFVSQTINLATWANYSAVDSGVSLSGL
jgi:prepilin-type processing-associated H-X9-DG protein